MCWWFHTIFLLATDCNSLYLLSKLWMTTPYMFFNFDYSWAKKSKGKNRFLFATIDRWVKTIMKWRCVNIWHFIMQVALKWTINNFPTYDMLSGWSTLESLTCPYCMNNSKSFWLDNGCKFSWFDCHHQFLPKDHAYRRNKNAFLNNWIEYF